MAKPISAAQSNAIAKAATAAGNNNPETLQDACHGLQKQFPEWRWKVVESETPSRVKTGNFSIKSYTHK